MPAVYAAGRIALVIDAPSAVTRPTGNLFLDNAPDKGWEALKSGLSPVSCASGQIIYERGDEMRDVLFPINSIISVVLEMTNGETAEVGIFGREGMSGVAIALGQTVTEQRNIVQVPDGALSIPAAQFLSALEADPELKTFVLRYAQALLMSTAYLSACNSLHPINERCARWLLMAHDRVNNDVLYLTQEFLSQMLGVRRAGVTLAASSLQQAGFISYSRGHIKVLDRAGLESATCECYGRMDAGWQALMGYSVDRTPSPAG